MLGYIVGVAYTYGGRGLGFRVLRFVCFRVY